LRAATQPYCGLLSVKLEGRKQISAVEFANGARLTERERFDNA